MIPAGIGLSGLSIGFMFVMTPIVSAAAGVLSADQVRVGLGILQGTQFLGAGTGPAVFGVLVTAAQLSGREAANPLHTGQDGAAYSDAFLVMAAVAVLALLVAYRMRPALAQGEAR